MTRFLDGPAAGVTLLLKRAPVYLRAVRSAAGEWDALDQVTDTPQAGERIYAYRMSSTAPTRVDDKYVPAGATVKDGALPAYSKLLGVASIFSMTPCTEAAAKRAAEAMRERKLILVRLPESQQLEAGRPDGVLDAEADQDDDTDDGLDDEEDDDVDDPDHAPDDEDAGAP